MSLVCRRVTLYNGKVDIPAYLSRPLACSMPPPLELMDQRRTEGVLVRPYFHVSLLGLTSA